MNDGTTPTDDEFIYATEILIAVIAIDQQIDKSEIQQLELELSGSEFSGQQSLKDAAISFVKTKLDGLLDTYTLDYVRQRLDKVHIVTLRKEIIKSAVAISFSDNEFHEQERAAIELLRAGWSI